MHPKRIAELPARVASKISVDENGCWVWTGASTQFGYGVIGRNGRSYGAHRVVYATLVGPIPEGLWVLHRCDNPPCCNPAHLFLGTHRDNMRDMVAKGRGGAKGSPGEANPKAKLTAADVLAIRGRYTGATAQALADEYGVARATVYDIVYRRSWRHVNPS